MLGVAVAILAFVAVLVVARRNAQDWSGVLPSTTIPAPATTAARSTAKVSTTTAPLTIDALIAIARIAANPASGEKGDELLKKLQEVQRENAQKPGGKSVQETARKAADEINEWVDEGELDPSIAVAQQVLQALAR